MRVGNRISGKCVCAVLRLMLSHASVACRYVDSAFYDFQARPHTHSTCVWLRIIPRVTSSVALVC